jgi:hypothetical protein
MKMEAIKVETKQGERSVWVIPFAWYKTKGIRTYRPMNKVQKLLAGLRSWELIEENQIISDQNL